MQTSCPFLFFSIIITINPSVPISLSLFITCKVTKTYHTSCNYSLSLTCSSCCFALYQLTQVSFDKDICFCNPVIDSTVTRAVLWTEHVDAISSDESSSSDADDGCGCQQSSNDTAAIKYLTSEGALFKKAELYLENMKQIPIPTHRGSIIPFTSGVGLGNSIKQLYQQPLHCLTNILLKQWDKSRFDSEDEYEPLDTVIHPCKAEATIWLIEEVHRHTSSHHHLAKL